MIGAREHDGILPADFRCKQARVIIEADGGRHGHFRYPLPGPLPRERENIYGPLAKERENIYGPLPKERENIYGPLPKERESTTEDS
jgi:hypothetical protein